MHEYTKCITRKSDDMIRNICVAIRDEEVLQIPLTESADSKPVKDLIERKVADNGNGRTSEDDWVEVKASDDSLLNNEKQVTNIFAQVKSHLLMLMW